MLRSVLLELRKHEALKLLNYNGFLLGLLSLNRSCRRYVRYVSALCFIVMSHNRTISNQRLNIERSLVIAQSAFSWRTADKKGAMHRICKLTEPSLFHPLMMRQIKRVFNLFELIQDAPEYLDEALLHLQRVRADWDIDTDTDSEITSLGYHGYCRYSDYAI